MSDIVEAVARAMAQKDAEDEGLKFPTSPTAYRTYMGLARAAIDEYEAAKTKSLEMSEAVVTDKFGREFTVRWPKSQEVNVMGIDFVAWDAVP